MTTSRKEYMRLYRKRNRIRLTEGNRKWRHENKELSRSYHRTPAHRARTVAWKTANPERVRAHNRKADAKRRHLTLMRLSATANVKATSARFAYYGNRCVYCGRGDLKLQLDHIKPLTKRGSNLPANWAPSCAVCNKRKGNKWAGSAAWIRCRDYGMSFAAISPDSAQPPNRGG